MKSRVLIPKASVAPTATVAEVARALGLTDSAVWKAAGAGHYAKPIKGRLDVLDVLRGWAARERARLAAKTNSDERIKSARAEKLELQNEAAKMDLIPADEVRRDTTRAFVELKSQLLAIDKRIEQSHGLEAGELVRKEIFSVLNLMSNYDWLKKAKSK